MNRRRKVTIDEVARLAGVSIKTVSRVINREPNVRDATRIKVEQAISKLNYRPSLSARSLASRRSHFILLAYDDPSEYENPSSGYIVRLQQGALRACLASNYELFIHPCSFRKRNVTRDLKAVIERTRTDGVILAAPLSNIPRIVDALDASGTAFIELSPGSKRPRRYAVATNDREISAEMTRYLASLGHRRIAFITGHPRHKAVSRRFFGYQDGLRQSQLPFDERLVAKGDNSFASGEQAARELLRSEIPPTAIFAANDDMAAGVIRTATRMGIAIPERLSVAGCDDISIAQHICPALTTIRQPLSAMAERAARILIDDGEGERSPSRIEILPATLKIRESTGPAPA